MGNDSLQAANNALSEVKYAWMDHQEFCPERSDLLQDALRSALPVNAIVDGISVRIGSIAPQCQIKDVLWFSPNNKSSHAFALRVYSICQFEAVNDV